MNRRGFITGSFVAIGASALAILDRHFAARRGPVKKEPFTIHIHTQDATAFQTQRIQRQIVAAIRRERNV